ncbi:MAG: hypothetical protein WA581_12965, partial [Candidatus Acidiferrales bacterium]
FIIYAYDQNYSDAADRLWDAVREGQDKERQQKQWDIMQAIQQKAPIVYFMTTGEFESSPAQKFLRYGARFLLATVYEKGVKVDALVFDQDGNSWVNPISGTARPRESGGVLRLSIEPATMRYAEETTVTTTSGICEKIPLHK